MVVIDAGRLLRLHMPLVTPPAELAVAAQEERTHPSLQQCPVISYADPCHFGTGPDPWIRGSMPLTNRSGSCYFRL
jgi:hypothetical protein